MDSGTLASQTHLMSNPAITRDFRATIFIASLCFIVVSTLAVSLKLLRSWRTAGRLAVHDYCILSAGICGIAMSAGCAHLTFDGLGQLDENGTMGKNAHYQLFLMVVNGFYFTCNFMIKIGLLEMYRNFTRERWGAISITFMEIMSVIFWLSSVMATFMQCLPLRALWDSSVTNAKCIDLGQFYLINACTMIGMDVVLYMMPIIFMRQLQLTRGKKFGLYALFGLGFVVVIVSCVRLWVIMEAIATGEMSFNYARSLFLSAIENHVAILIACLPAVRHLIMKQLTTLFSDLSSRKEKLSKMWSSTAGSPPSTPMSDRFRVTGLSINGRFGTDTDSDTVFGSPTSKMWSPSSRTTHTLNNSNDDADDIELGLRPKTAEFQATITNTIDHDVSSPASPVPSKQKIYLTRDFEVREEVASEPATPVRAHKPMVSPGSGSGSGMSRVSWLRSLANDSASVTLDSPTKAGSLPSTRE